MPHGRIAGLITMAFIVPWLLLGAVLLLIFSPFAAALNWGLAVTLIALGGLLVWLSWTWPERNHRHSRYRVEPGGIEFRSGVWWRTSIRVPRSRIQHTDVSQGPLERHYGLATLRLFTAGTEHSEVALHGLEHGTALRIRDFLITGDVRDGV